MDSRRIAVHLLLVYVVLAFTFVSTDAAGNAILSNGTIDWADFPKGQEYSTPDEYDEGAPPLPAVWDMMYGWINTISPGDAGDIYEALGGLFNGGGGIDISSLQDLAMANLTKLFMGFVICLVIGVLFLLIFPIVCCCFCCCRMCGNCGGKMHQKETSMMGCKKIAFIIVLLSVTSILGFGVACGYFVNERTGDVINGLEDNVVDTIDDMLKFVNNTVEELTFVALEQTVWLVGQVLNDFSDVGGTLGQAIKDSASGQIQPAIDAMITMVDNMEVTKDGLDNIRSIATNLETDFDTFCDDVEALKTDIDSLFSGCGSCPSVLPDTTDVICNTLNLSVSGVPHPYPQAEVDAKIVALQVIIDGPPKPKDEAEAGKKQFDDIPITVQNASSMAISSLNGTFGDFLSQIDGAIEPLMEQLSGMTGGIDDMKDSISGMSEVLAQYDKYRWYAMNGLHGVVLLVVVFNIIGILFGLLGSRANASPTDRSGLSNCGGLFLMASAGFCFIFACFYMFLTVIPFVIGAPINKFICQPLLSGDILEDTIDNPDGFMGSDGYYLAKMLLKDGSIELTVSGALEDCEDGATSYTAFHLQSFFNISKYTDFDQYLKDDQFDDLTSDIDLSDIEIMSPDTESSLNDFKAANVDNIAWGPYEAELAKDLLPATYEDSIIQLAQDIEDYVAAHALSGPDETALLGQAAAVRDFQTSVVEPMVAQRDAVDAEIKAFKVDAGAIDPSVDDAINKGNVADDYFEQNDIKDVVDDEVEKYKERIKSTLDQFSQYVEKSIGKDIGKCKPVKNVIDNIFNLICRSFLDPFNAFWFINGWYVFFFMPSIIFGIKLAKFFRRMKTADSHSDTMELQTYPEYGQGAPFNNKVAAGPV
ncbi:prominin-1-A-like isoform X2 [Ptychodera flava]